MGEAAGVWLLGLAYGATVCSLSCLPLLGAYLLGCGGGFRDGVSAALVFLAGKATSYAMLGGAAGLVGQVLTVSGGRQRMFLGLVLIAVALALPLVAGKRCGSRPAMAGRGGSLFLLGATSSLAPCPPLAAILLLAAGSGGWLTGTLYGLLYGGGLMVSPLLIAAGGLALIGRNIQVECAAFQPYLRGAVMLIMGVMGLRLLWTAPLA